MPTASPHRNEQLRRSRIRPAFASQSHRQYSIMNLRIGLTRDHPAFNNSRQFSSCRRLETHFGRCVSLSNGEWRGIPRWLGWHGLMRRTFSPSLLLRQLLPWPKQFDDLCEHRPTCHTGSVSGAVFMIVHSDFDLEQACTIENSPASAATNSEAVSNFFAPSAVFRLRLVGQPDLHHIAVLFLADAGE
jgi:hypothetical protein